MFDIEKRKFRDILNSLSNEDFFGDSENEGIYDMVIKTRNHRLQTVANANLSTMRKKGGVDAK